MQNLNQTQFAKHLGVSKGYVSQLKSAGRMVFAENGLVDVEASILRIQQTQDENRDDVKARHAAERAENKKPGKKEPKEKDPNQISFSEGRAKEQHYKSLQAELEYQKAIGELVSTKDMQAAVADVVTTFRQAMENLPHRLASDLVGKDMDFIRATLKQECHAVLANLSRDFSEKINYQESESA